MKLSKLEELGIYLGAAPLIGIAVGIIKFFIYWSRERAGSYKLIEQESVSKHALKANRIAFEQLKPSYHSELKWVALEETIPFYAFFAASKEIELLKRIKSSRDDILQFKKSNHDQTDSLATEIIENFNAQKFIPESNEACLVPEGYTWILHDTDRRNVPPPLRYYMIMTGPYKPLGYYEGTLPQEKTLQWLITKNREIPGNCRLSETLPQNYKGMKATLVPKYFYNEEYLKKLLELNIEAFDCNDKDEEYKHQIFDANNKVKHGGIAAYVAGHQRPMKGPMLALVHAAFGDPALKDCHKQILIPNEPGLRDVIHLQEKYPDHLWINIQALLRGFNNVSLVSKLLEKMPSDALYYVQDGQVRKKDASCKEYPVLSDIKTMKERFVLREGKIEPFVLD